MLPRNQLTAFDSVTSLSIRPSSDPSSNMLSSKLCQLYSVSRTKIHPRLLLHVCNALETTEKPAEPKPQVNLAYMPVQNLNKMLSKFMETCKPLVSCEEYEETMKEAREMIKEGSTGFKLQAMLTERAQTHQNWLADWWMRAAYLEFRAPVMPWSSPGATYAYKYHKTDDEFITYAAKVVLGVLEFKKLIDTDAIKQEYAKNIPLDMQQNRKVLGACRIPAAHCDYDEYHPDSKHVVVACNNHYYRIDVYDEASQPIGLRLLKNQLQCILASSKDAAPAIGLLTSTHRDTWAENYKLLNKYACNQACIQNIQSSIFLLCLDKPLMRKYQKNSLTAASHQMFHGGGPCCNSANRWSDKIIQLVVSRDGMSGVTYEHSTAEAIPVMQMGDLIQDHIENDNFSISNAKFKDPAPRELVFKVDAKISEAIENATVEVATNVNDIELSIINFEDYGKDFIKENELSPDSFIQMMMQYAYYKVHGEPGAQYESGSLRQYMHGRTEAIRSCSCASVDFAKAMLDEEATDKDKFKALKSAVAAHKAYSVDAMNGRGVDRHLLGLKMQALDANIELPKFFNSPGYVKSTNWMMGTSNVPTKYKGLMSYSAMTKDGYGICYNPRGKDILISVSSYKSSDHSKNAEMTEALTQAFVEVGKLLESYKRPKSKL